MKNPLKIDILTSKFENLFGINPNEVKKTCVLLPLTPKGLLKILGIEKLTRAGLYASSQTENATVICTGMGAGLVGDALLYLGETPCQNIVLFGSCGAISKKLPTGSLVTPKKSLNLESFSDWLFDDNPSPRELFPDKTLSTYLEDFYKDQNIRIVNCATVGSLKLEEERHVWLAKNDIDVVDMECSGLFSASKKCALKALALFYVSDVIKKKPFYLPDSNNLPMMDAIYNVLFSLIKMISQQV